MTGKYVEDSSETPRGPLGDARPDARPEPPKSHGGQPPEKVEDRPTVGTVKPEDYPAQERRDGAVIQDNTPYCETEASG
jgi:hypothetical protein